MAVQTMTMTTWQYYPRRKTDDLKALDNLPDGTDFLKRLHGLFHDASVAELSEQAKNRYLNVQSVIPKGRTLLVTFAAGRGGIPGEVVDSQTGSSKYQHGGDESHVITVQALFVAPAGSTTVLMFCDYVHGLSARKRVIDIIKSRWIGMNWAYTLNPVAVTYGKAWIKSADLEGVTALIYRYESDLVDGAKPVKVGRIRHEIRPERGSRILNEGKRLLKQLEKGGDRSTLLGLAEEPDEVKVTLGDGDSQRTFVLGDEGTPMFRAVFASDGEPPLVGESFAKQCRKEAMAGKDALSIVGFQWDDQTAVGQWSDADLAVRWDHVSG